MKEMAGPAGPDGAAPAATRAARTAAWIAEAFATGRPLTALPAEVAPRGRAEGERAAFAALEALGIAPCGVRLLDGMAGPMIATRLIPSGALAAPLRHPVVTAALVGVLAEALRAGDEARPRFAALHIALDIADHRFAEPPPALGWRVADLAGLGFVAAGPAMVTPPAAMAAEGAAFLPREVLAPVAAAARRLGGLPPGGLLVAAGLSPPLPVREGAVRAAFGEHGAVTARLG